MSRVLITGVSGHLGNLLAQTLVTQPGIDFVVGVDTRPPSRQVPGMAFDKCDVTQPHWLAGHLSDYRIDTVVHLAWDRGKWGGDPDRTNIDGTFNLLRDIADNPVKRLIFASSDAVYGYEPRENIGLRENAGIMADEKFTDAWHLVQVEHMLALFSEERPEIEQTIIRFGAVLGADSHEPSVEMLRYSHLLHDKHVDTQFSFISNIDAAAALVQAVTSAETGIFNAVGDGTVSIDDLAKALNKPVEIGSAWSLKRFLKKQRRMGRPALEPNQLAMAIHRPRMLTGALKTTLGFRPQSTSAEALTTWADQ